MTACGARTWVAPDEMLTCDRPAGHDADTSRFGAMLDPDGAHATRSHVWREPGVALLYRDDLDRVFNNVAAAHEARALVASLQRQLDALDPDAAIAEAERRMVEAYERQRRLSSQADDARDSRHVEALVAAANAAFAAWQWRVADWLALVEARDAKARGGL